MTSREVRAFVRSVQSAPPVTDTTLVGVPPLKAEVAEASTTPPSQTVQNASASSPISNIPSGRADRAPDPHASLVRSVQRDRQVISAILKRWQTLRTGGAAQQAIIDEVLEAILVQISTMISTGEPGEEQL